MSEHPQQTDRVLRDARSARIALATLLAGASRRANLLVAGGSLRRARGGRDARGCVAADASLGLLEPTARKTRLLGAGHALMGSSASQKRPFLSVRLGVAAVQ